MITKKFQYWHHTDTLNFSVSIIKAPASWSSEEVSEADSGMSHNALIRGPFPTITEARKDAREIINDTIREYQRMKEDLRGEPSVFGDGEDA